MKFSYDLVDIWGCKEGYMGILHYFCYYYISLKEFWNGKLKRKNKVHCQKKKKGGARCDKQHIQEGTLWINSAKTKCLFGRMRQ